MPTGRRGVPAALALREGADFRDFGRVLSLFGLGDAKMLLGERDEAYEYWRQAYQLGFFSGDLGRLLTDFAGALSLRNRHVGRGGRRDGGRSPRHTAGCPDRGSTAAIQTVTPSRPGRVTWPFVHELASGGGSGGGPRAVPRHPDRNRTSNRAVDGILPVPPAELRVPAAAPGTRRSGRKLSMCCGTATRWSTARWRKPCSTSGVASSPGSGSGSSRC